MRYIQKQCPHCNDIHLIESSLCSDGYECPKCKMFVEPPSATAFYIGSGRAGANKHLSREFADCVINPIMGQKGANNKNRQYG